MLSHIPHKHTDQWRGQCGVLGVREALGGSAALKIGSWRAHFLSYSLCKPRNCRWLEGFLTEILRLIAVTAVHGFDYTGILSHPKLFHIQRAQRLFLPCSTEGNLLWEAGGAKSAGAQESPSFQQPTFRRTWMKKQMTEWQK